MTLKQRPDLCLSLGCPLSRAQQARAGQWLFAPQILSAVVLGNRVTECCCWSSLASALGAVSWTCPWDACQTQAFSVETSFKIEFFGFSVLFFPNENNPRPMNHHLG